MATLAERSKSFPLREFQWKTLEDFSQCVQQCEELLECEVQHSFASIDMNKTFKQLYHAGQLLQLCLTQSRASPCCAHVLDVTMKYQGLCHRGVAISEATVTKCVSALRCHKHIEEAIEAKKEQGAALMLGTCANLAQEVVALIGEVESMADSLVERAASALVSAKDDQNVAQELKEKLDRDLQKQASDMKSIEQKLTGLNAAYAEACAEEERKSATADKEHERHHQAKMVKAAFSLGLSLINDKPDPKLAELDGYAREAIAVRADLLGQVLRQKSEVVRAACELERMNGQMDMYNHSVMCLGVAVQTLGMVKTSFSLAKMMWSTIVQKCEAVKSLDEGIKDMMEIDIEDGGLGADVKHSAVTWATIGYVNMQANKNMAAAARNVDGIMHDIPFVALGDQTAQAVNGLKEAMLAND